ncbi:unnamed protein product, partial [Adineta steineri]
HFLGGTISWKVVNNNNVTNGIVSVMFTQSYQWVKSATYCNQSYIFALPPLSSIPAVLKCITAPSSCGGYTSLNTQGYCTASRSKFCVAFQNEYWTT